ncbi:MAG: TM2 domain-containing protein [Clostridia bacterium]|nr:TM2 domain-containing protein [Clostridia bacterium]
MKKCEYCGATLNDDVTKCEYCNANQPILQNEERSKFNTQPQPPQQIIINNYQQTPPQQPVQPNYYNGKKPKNKWVGFLLCFFFGIFGVHRFYEGRIFSGILFLFTCGFMGIGWLIDTIVRLFNSNPYYV